MADIKKIVSSMRETGVCGEKLCEIETSAKWYAKCLREKPVDGDNEI